MSSDIPVRETYRLMPPGTDVIMYIVLIPFAALFLYGIYRRVRVYGIEWSELFRDFPTRMGNLVRYALLQRKVVREKTAGVMHLLIYSGIIALLIATTLVFIDYDILRNFNQSILRGQFYLFYEAIFDFMGLLLLAGLTILLYRRFIARERRLRWKDEYLLIFLGLFFLGITGYILEGLRLYIAPRPWGSWSFVGKAVSDLFAALSLDLGAALGTYRALWWAHAIVTFTMVALLPYSNLLHVLATFGNAYFSTLRDPNPGKMPTPFRIDQLDPETAEIKLGARSVDDLNWRQRLGLDACTDCGRCEAACPAFASGTPLSPRMIVQKLREEMWYSKDKMNGGARDLFAAGIIEEDEVWACTTCAACVEACPVLISPLEYILEMRRALTLEGKLDKRKTTMLTNLSRLYNPYGLPQHEREQFLQELRSMGVKTLAENPEAEYLYWIGCASSYDARSREIVRSMVKILQAAGVNFAILGEEELCTGDPARRIGEEGRFQELALTNIELFKNYNVRKILTHCPHCFNTFKNEYPDLGGSYTVIHHTQLIGELLKSGRIKPKRPLAEKLTLHDSCYLGRINGIIEEPRMIINSVAGEGFVEMQRIGRRSFCCGAGGANYWYEVKRENRESVIRLNEAMNTGASTMVVECPYCLQMFNDATRIVGAEEKIRLKDISEVVAETLE